MLKAPPPTTATTTTTPSSSKPPQKLPLRKATYVTIEKLVHSQYNFQLDKLNEEIKNAFKADKKNANNTSAATGEEEKENVVAPKTRTPTPPNSYPAAVSSTAAAVANLDIEGKVVDTAHTATTSNTEQRPESKPNAWVNSPLKVLPGPVSTHQQQQQGQGSQVLPPHSIKFHHGHTSRLQPPRDGFNLCVLVGKVDIVVDKLRVDGTRVLVAEVQVGDNTGSISLRARDDQINVLKQVSKERGAVVLRNCTVELHQGKYLRLAVSKWGKMKVYPDGIESTPHPPLRMNEERNYSLVDLNVVVAKKDGESANRNASSNLPLFDTKQQHQYPKQQHWEHSPSRSAGPRSYQRRSTNRYQRKQPPSMYSHPQPLYIPLQQRSQGGQPAFPYYQPYAGGGDASSVYSYQSHSTENTCSPPPHGQRLYHHPHPPYQTEHYNRQQQQLMYQQYELQQRHAQQMQMLQETQRRLMAVEQQRMGVPPQQGMGINMVESHESGEDYSIPSTIAMGPPSVGGGSYGHPPPPPPPMGYAYGFEGANLSSPMRNMLMPGEQRRTSHQQEGQPQHQHPVITDPSTDNAAIVSPPVSPQRFGHSGPPPPPAYPPDSLLYFDQSGIPLTGMQEQIESGYNEEGYDDSIQF